MRTSSGRNGMHKVRKSVASAFLLTVIVCGFLSLSNMPFGVAQTSTKVGGTVRSNTVWTKANSPYNLTGPMLVSRWATLTIEPGVTVDFNNFYMLVNGTLYARGNSTDPIHFINGCGLPNWAITFTEQSVDWNEETGSGCIIENTVLNSTGVAIWEAYPKINNNSLSAENAIDIYASDVPFVECSPVISNNTIDGDIGIHWTSPVICNNYIIGGIYGASPEAETETVISNNTIRGGGRGNGIGIAVSDVNISNNLISDCTVGIECGGITQNNTIVNNFVGINASSNVNSIRYNNFENNSHYSLYYRGPPLQTFRAIHNWWGTNDTSAINQTIYDSKNDFRSGTVIFTPFLTEPNPQAPKVPDPEPEPELEPEQPGYSTPIVIAVSVTALVVFLGLPIYFGKIRKKPKKGIFGD